MTIRDEYEKRIIEVDSFYEILNIIELENPRIIAYNLEEEKEDLLQISSKKIDTLRSTAYLLLYNIIESTVYNSVALVFDTINDNGLKYFDIIEELQRYWLNNLYKHDDKKKKETIVDTIMNVAVQIFNNTIALATNEISYGGSLDAKAIFATAKSMKIDVANVHRMYSENIHGQTLIDVKKKRNWLAHGEKSFIEIGSSTTLLQLQEAKSHVFDFLNEFISSVEAYIANEQYKISGSLQTES
ncbi:MAG: MAE_28990/MAE_18760 family HEPN-like nuclease [Flavobacterium sp.]|jgi:hypothetical protein|nr:MAE_28990/MAE_18760 family HEPN-like nuclease [Flavobacterium sp.]